MGEFADYANDEQIQSLEDLMDYECGSLSEQEAMDRGILDEDGTCPNVTVWGVHDAQSLEDELNKCELEFIKNKPLAPLTRKQFWFSNGKLVHPKNMTTEHLKNAIKFAEKRKMTGPAVEEIKKEYEVRLLDD